MTTPTLINTTALLDYTSPAIQRLIENRRWRSLEQYDQIGAVYTFVKNEVLFGYNRSDDMSASAVLMDGYGQCNTKATLLMALLRALSIPCRLHGFTIDKALQAGAIPPVLQQLAPQRILHSWVEVLHKGKWIILEGFILDDDYLRAIQQKFSEQQGPFCGYGIATTCLASPPVDWQGQDTFIQSEGLADDFGLFDDPDSFYRKKGTNLRGFKRWFFEFVGRHIMNFNVARLRRGAEKSGSA